MSEQDPFDHLNHIADGRILASKDELLALIAESNRKAVRDFVADLPIQGLPASHSGGSNYKRSYVLLSDIQDQLATLKEPRKEAE